MNITFRTNALEACAFNRQRAERAWGTMVGQNYVDRIAIILAAEDLDTLREYRHFRVHQLRGRRHGTWALNLSSTSRLIFEHDEEANAILIIEVTDYHA